MAPQRPQPPRLKPAYWLLAAAIGLWNGANLLWAGAGEGTPPSHCPFHESTLEEAGSSPQALRAASKVASPSGIRFTHTAALDPGETDKPLPKPHQETRRDSSVFRTWEFMQLGIIVASSIAVFWFAHRRLED